MLWESIADKLYTSINKLVSEEVEKIAKQLYKTRKEQDLAIENAKLKNQIEEMQWQIKDPHLLFVKTIWMTENESWFYIFRNVKDNNYELRVFNLAWTYPLNNSFDTIEWAIEYIETIKHRNYWHKPLTTIKEVQNYEWNTIWM